MLKGTIAGVVMATLAAGAYAQDDGSQIEVQYCGVGYLGQAQDLKTTYRFLESTVLSPKGRPELGGRLKTLAQDANAGVKFVASSSDAISYVISAAKHEVQEYRNPLPPNNQMYNVIYTLTIQTVLFNKDSKEIKGVYPWTYQFNDAMATKPADKDIVAKFKSFFDEPPALKEGEEPDPQLFMVQWREAMANFRPVANAKTIAVAPVTFSPAAEKSLTDSIAKAGTKDTVAGLGIEVTSTFETELSKKLGLPIVPGGGATGVSGEKGPQFIASIPDCLNAGGQSFALPTPSYRFFLSVDEVASASLVRREARKVVGANGVITEEPITRTENGYGARYVLNLVAPDESDTSEWGGPRIITDHKLKFVAAKRFTGDRQLNDFDQYRKLSLAFTGDLASAFMSRDEKWIKNQLSTAMGKTKPSAIRKEWIEIFEKRMGLARAKKR
jgi:hypothetical protein